MFPRLSGRHYTTSPRAGEVGAPLRVRDNNKLTGGTFSRFSTFPLNVILERERSELSRESRNKMSIFFKWMYHSGSSANELSLKAKDDVESWCEERWPSVCYKFFKYPSPDVITPTSPARGEVGKSMIEMLGVLAIIAVLTAGGLVGFNKAMSAYRWNMALGQWDTLINVVVKYKAQLHLKSDETGEITLLPIFEATGELPDNVPVNMSISNGKPNAASHIVDAMGNKIYIYSHSTNYVGIRSGYSGKSSYESCRLFMNMSKQNHALIDYAEFYDIRPIIIFYGDSKCTKDLEALCLKNFTVSKINEICKDEKIFNANLFLIYWF